MFKEIARKPRVRKHLYSRFGFMVTDYVDCLCPRCRGMLNAGPNYQPKYCDQCGQRIDFRGIVWKEEEEIGVIPLEQRRAQNE
jgi:hypothetical protein